MICIFVHKVSPVDAYTWKATDGMLLWIINR
jgi:hypothetical protein